MHVLFEEDGAFKTATILTDNDNSLQVETATGKRAKIKSANILLRYKEPSPNELLSRAEKTAEDIETEFLWECAGDGEFLFSDSLLFSVSYLIFFTFSKSFPFPF